MVIDGPKGILSTRATAPGWETWARRKPRVSMVVPLFAPETRANDRVPRFSRRVLADNVRFDMTGPSLPPMVAGWSGTTDAASARERFGPMRSGANGPPL